MKKNILFVFASVFVITIKASESNEISSVKFFDVGLYGETRGDTRPLEERLRSLKTRFDFRDVTLTLLDPKVMSLSEGHSDNSIQLLELKKNQSKVELKATLIDNKMMNSSVSGLLLAVFSSDAFVRDIVGQVKNENIYFKISGLDKGYKAEFYFSVPSAKIISDFGLQNQSQKAKIFEKNEQSGFLWLKYTIPFGLLVILSVWYFKYKN